jgi:hypothetical protein
MPIADTKSARFYESRNVFDGTRPLTATHAARLREIVDQQTRRPSRKKTTATTRSRRAKTQKPI